MIIWTKQISFKITLLSSNNLCTCQSWSLKCFRYSLMADSLLFLYIMNYNFIFDISAFLYNTFVVETSCSTYTWRINWIAFPNFLRWISKIKVKVKIKLNSPGLLLFYIKFHIKYSLTKSFQIWRFKFVLQHHCTNQPPFFSIIKSISFFPLILNPLYVQLNPTYLFSPSKIYSYKKITKCSPLLPL